VKSKKTSHRVDARQAAVESPIEDEILPSGIAQRRVARTTRSETFQSLSIERGTYAHSKIQTTRRVSQVRRLNLGGWPRPSSRVAYRLRFCFFANGGHLLLFPRFYSLLSAHCSLLTVSPHFSTHFHSRNKPITPLPTPSNLTTSLDPIRIRPSRSNESVSKTKRY
jgi:hypothetical protein